MELDMGDIAGILAGTTEAKVTTEVLKSGTQNAALTDTLLTLGAGMVIGGVVGFVVVNVFDNLFGD